MNRAVCGGQDSGVRGVVLVLGTALGAEYLDALIVTVDCLAAVVDHADGAVCELEGDESGVYVAGLTDARIDQNGTDRIDLSDLAARQEARHVEVVDHHIIEDAAGNLDIGYRRRLRVAGGDLDDIDLADLAAADHVVNGAVVVVEAAAEADLELDACFLRRVDGSVHLGQIIVDRLLAEDVLASVSSLDDVLGMGVGRGADEHCFDLGIVQDVICVLGGVRDAAGLGKSLGLLIHERVGDGLDLRHEHRNVLCVYLADASGTDNAYFHLLFVLLHSVNGLS